MMTELRKLSNHPLLMRNFYKNLDLPEIAKKLASDPSYKETKVEYIIEDLSFMSDFEIHSLTKEHKVSTLRYTRICLYHRYFRAFENTHFQTA